MEKSTTVDTTEYSKDWKVGTVLGHWGYARAFICLEYISWNNKKIRLQNLTY
jgi:hypothetical protein